MSSNGDRAPPVGVLQLFFAFSRIALLSFGGGVPVWIHRAFVQRRHVLTESEFAAAFTLARIMPGANVVNLAVLVGHRAGGARGAAAACLGLLLGPTVLSIMLVVVYQRVAETAFVALALKGAAFAAAGLLIAMGVESGTRLLNKRHDGKPASGAAALAICVALAVFVLVGIFEQPTVATVLVLSPVSIALSHATSRSSRASTRDGT
jgi:chromate transporter